MKQRIRIQKPSPTRVQGYRLISFFHYSPIKAIDISILLISLGFSGRIHHGLHGSQKVQTDAPEALINSLFNLSINHSTILKPKL